MGNFKKEPLKEPQKRNPKREPLKGTLNVIFLVSALGPLAKSRKWDLETGFRVQGIGLTV